MKRLQDALFERSGRSTGTESGSNDCNDFDGLSPGPILRTWSTSNQLPSNCHALVADTVRGTATLSAAGPLPFGSGAVRNPRDILFSHFAD